MTHTEVICTFVVFFRYELLEGKEIYFNVPNVYERT